jgi:hypothetical protein
MTRISNQGARKMGCTLGWRIRAATIVGCALAGRGGPLLAQVSTAYVQAEAAGRYSVLREGGKDTGCMLTLDAKGTTQRKGKASLAPGCRDQGIVIFDPAGWEIMNGRLVLTARKGHKAHFDARSDGSWEKDAAEGKALSLKKL